MFLNPLGLLALLGVPAVIALHLFRRRFKRQQVSALFLWQARTTTSVSGRRRDRILRSPSFWCELFLALLLGIAFAGPRACGQLEARHLVVVLDGSASMAAHGTSEDPSAAQLTREALRDAIDGLPGGSRVTVVESGALPRILIGPAAFPEEARARLGEYTPSAARHDLEPSVALAQELAGNGAVTLFTDHFEPERFPPDVGIVALGRARENLAITRAARAPGAEEGNDVFLSVSNFSDRSKSARLGVLQDGVLLAEERALLAAGERRHFQFTLPADAGLVEARLDDDALSTDNVAFLAPLPVRTLALYTDISPLERRALGLQRGTLAPLDHWLALVGDAALAPGAEMADFVITSASKPQSEAWELVLAETRGEALDLVGPFLIEKRHAAVRGVSLDGVVWSAGAETPMPGIPLISAGNLPLLSEERLGNRRIFHLNIAWSRSSLQRTPDWPILLTNLAELRRRELRGARSTNLGAGETFHFQTADEADYELATPSGTRELRARGVLDLDQLDEVGVYELRRDGENLVQFAVHFADDAESDLRTANRGQRTSSVELGEQRSSSSLLVLLLALFALCLLLLDWWVLRARTAKRAAQPSAGGIA